MELVKAGVFLQGKWSQCNVTSQNYYSKHITTSLKMKYTFMVNASRQFQNFSKNCIEIVIT